ncbi:Rrf2 family transcriptional regulator [Rhodopila sp.]|uniref:Rrf2 family transcriptional regulator n=1 Tax=Rhodopila sp. TaxID=2480087 RepID=UPI003D0BE3F9
MQLSTKGRYAVIAMVDLAHRETADQAADLICLADIAGRQQLSQSYLEQLLAKLRRADLVHAARGPRGGYRLTRPAADIAIAEIVAAVDEPIKATRCGIDSGRRLAVPGSMIGVETCHTHDLWLELGRQIMLFLRGISLADVALGRLSGRTIAAPSPRAGDAEPGPP